MEGKRKPGLWVTVNARNFSPGSGVSHRCPPLAAIEVKDFQSASSPSVGSYRMQPG
jgi:hypothetical protein